MHQGLWTIANVLYYFYFLKQTILDSVGDGQRKLDAVTQEGQMLYAHLPKQVVSSIQEQITKANEEFQAFLRQCLKDKQALQDCALELGRWVVLIQVDFILCRMSSGT